MKNVYFVINEKNKVFELWVDGKCKSPAMTLTIQLSFEQQN